MKINASFMASPTKDFLVSRYGGNRAGRRANTVVNREHISFDDPTGTCSRSKEQGARSKEQGAIARETMEIFLNSNLSILDLNPATATCTRHYV